MTSAIETQVALQRMMGLAAIFFALIFLAIFLATSSIFVLYLALGVAWLFLLPYHSRLAIWVSVATFSSALILPYIPGRPFFWEFAALLGWSGLAISLLLRQFRPEAPRIILENWPLFLGSIGYSFVLLITMYYVGVGFRIFGSGQMGGRFYVQQLVCAIFPLVFAMTPLTPKTITRLFFLQCLLTLTFLVSDFIFSVAPQTLFFMLQFFELSGDALSFETQASQFGIRRYQSLYVVSTGLILIIFAKANLSQFLTARGLYLVPLFLGIIGLGVFSGHRYLFLLIGFTLLFASWGQRMYTARNLALGASILGLCLFIAYGYAERLPMAAQRALTFLPGISVAKAARDDGMATMEVRRILRKVGWDMVPDYLWVGRGFGQAAWDHSTYFDQTGVTMHVNMGRFYNGFIGLMVNTGLFGTMFMLLFLSWASWIALKILNHLRRYGCYDDFDRVCSVLAGMWMAYTIAFLFLHGDSEFAMKNFSLQAGLLLACYYGLKQRQAERDSEAAQQPAPQPAKAPAAFPLVRPALA